MSVPYTFDRILDELGPFETALLAVVSLLLMAVGVRQIRAALRLRRHTPEAVWRVRERFLSGIVAILLPAWLLFLTLYTGRPSSRLMLALTFAVLALLALGSIVGSEAEWEEGKSSATRRFVKRPFMRRR